MRSPKKEARWESDFANPNGTVPFTQLFGVDLFNQFRGQSLEIRENDDISIRQQKKLRELDMV